MAGRKEPKIKAVHRSLRSSGWKNLNGSKLALIAVGYLFCLGIAYGSCSSFLRILAQTLIRFLRFFQPLPLNAVRPGRLIMAAWGATSKPSWESAPLPAAPGRFFSFPPTLWAICRLKHISCIKRKVRAFQVTAPSCSHLFFKRKLTQGIERTRVMLCKQ